jgi:hypothetical protein
VRDYAAARKAAREFGFGPTSAAANKLAKHLWDTLEETRHLLVYDIWWLQEVAEAVDRGVEPLVNAAHAAREELGYETATDPGLTVRQLTVTLAAFEKKKGDAQSGGGR